MLQYCPLFLYFFLSLKKIYFSDKVRNRILIPEEKKINKKYEKLLEKSKLLTSDKLEKLEEKLNKWTNYRTCLHKLT